MRRKPPNPHVISARSSRTTSSQSESASISAKALKMLTLQKRQLDHLQQQVGHLKTLINNSKINVDDVRMWKSPVFLQGDDFINKTQCNELPDEYYEHLQLINNNRQQR